MNECDHFSIRGYVAERRERDWRQNYPFPLPQNLTPEQIKSLLPPMESPKLRRWNCHCPHPLNGAGPSEAELVTRTDNSSVDKVNGDASVAITAVDNALKLVNCTEKLQALLFDLNETPTDLETWDETLEMDDPAAEEEVKVDNSEYQIAAKLPSVDEKHTGNIEDQEASEMPINNGCPSPEMDGDDSFEDADDELSPCGKNGPLVKRKPPKYRALSELSVQAKREKLENVQLNGTTGIVPTQDLRLKKTESKKMQLSGIQEKQGTRISQARKDATGKIIKKRTFNFKLPSEQKNYLLAGVKLQPRPVPCAKRNQQVSPDKNVNSDTSHSSEKGPAASQNETGNFLLPRKRRIFGDGDAERSHQVKPGALQRRIHKRHASHKHDPSSSKEKQSLNRVSVPTQSKKAESKEANQQVLGAKQKKKDEKTSPEERSTAAGKELVLRDRPTSTVTKDVAMAAPQNETRNKLLPKKRRRAFGDKALRKHIDTDKLCQLKSVAVKNGCVSLKRVERDSSSSDKKQNINPVDEHGTCSPTQTKKSAGKDANSQMVGAKRKKKHPSEVSCSASKERGPAIVDGPISSHLPPGEEALSGMLLLSMVAAEDLGDLSDTKISGPIGAIRDEVHAPVKTDVLAMGYNGCAQGTVPTDYVLIDEEGDPFKLGPEDLPLRSHRIIKPVEQNQRMCSSMSVSTSGPMLQLAMGSNIEL